MLIVGQEILEKRLLLDAKPEHISNATYYLTIEKLIRGGEEEEKDTIVIAPGEIIWVVSKEIFNIADNNCIALVSLKSGLTKQGLLALDTGFVDPRFEGPIGTVLVNFSKNSVTIAKGEEFFRVLFFNHKELPDQFVSRQLPKYESVREYADERKKEISRDYESKFLNIDSIVETVKNDIMDKAVAKIQKDIGWELVKAYWGKIIVIIAVLCLAGYYYLGEIVPDLTKDDVYQMINETIADKLPTPNIE